MLDTIVTVFKIMFFSAIGTIGILVPVIAIPAGIGFLITKHFKDKEDSL